MKNRELLIANGIIIMSVFCFVIFTFNIFSNQTIKEILNETLTNIVKEDKSDNLPMFTKCSTKDPLNLNTQQDENLIKLAEYQDICDSYVTNKLMFFTHIPFDQTSAQELAFTIATKLDLFKQNNIQPIVIVEPYTGGNLLRYRDFLNGVYNKPLDTFFFELKQRGVTDEMMGTWVPFPESNTPNWDNKDTEPSDFGIVVNTYLRSLKKYFPNAKGSILLNATTYEPDDVLWDNGDYISLAPYLVNIDKTLVDSFGIQGFPWAPNAQFNAQEIFRASEFIQPDIAIGAAQELRTRDVWINTGSFYQKYTNDEEKRITISLNDRKAILEGIIEVAKYIKNYQLNEYRVEINLFSEDKSNYNEATDWSYMQNDEHKEMLKEFLLTAEEEEIPISLFDKSTIE